MQNNYIITYINISGGSVQKNLDPPITTKDLGLRASPPKFLYRKQITLHRGEIQYTMWFADKEPCYKAWCSGAEKQVLKKQLHEVSLS